MGRRLIAGFNVPSLSLPRERSTGPGADDFDVLDGAVDPLFLQPCNLNIYHEARLVAEQAKRDITAALDPDGIRGGTPGFLAFLFSLQFKLALEDIPLARTAATLGSRYSRVEVWNNMGNADWLNTADLNTTPLIFQQSNPASVEKLAALSPDPEDSGTDPDSAGTGLPLLIIGSDVDIDLGVEYFRRVTPSNVLNVLLKRNDQQLVARLTELHPDLRIRQLFSLNELRTRRRDIILQLIQRYQNTSGVEQKKLSPIMPLLVKSMHNALSLEDLLSDIRPALIFGTLEKSPLGVALSSQERLSDTRLVSYQHGIMSSTRTMDYFRFDTFFVWDDTFRKLVLDDGYRDASTIAVSDRRPRIVPRTRPFSRMIRRLADTKVVFFEQPLQKSPYSLAEYRSVLATLSLLASEYKFSIWVKPHPRTFGIETYEAATEGLPRVHRFKKQVRMEQLPDIYLFAIGMTSTALLDFMCSGRQAVSYDPKGWTSMTGLPPDLFSYSAETRDQLEEKVRFLIGR